MAKKLSETEREALNQTSREKYFTSSILNTSFHRYGLFSYAPLYSDKDFTYRKTKPRQRDSNGDVITAPRQVTIYNPKKGKGPDAYFSPPQFHTYNDPYIDHSKVKHLGDHIRAQKAQKLHEVQFVPSGSVSHRYTDYEYKPQDPIVKKIVHKDAQGQVIIGPRNILTNPPKKGTSMTPDITLAKYPYHKEDDYNNAKKIASKERAMHQAKLQENPFKPVSLHGNSFVNNINTYGGIFPEKVRYLNARKQLDLYLLVR